MGAVLRGREHEPFPIGWESNLCGYSSWRVVFVAVDRKDLLGPTWKTSSGAPRQLERWRAVTKDIHSICGSQH